MIVDPHLLQLYLAAAFVLVLIPGPDTLLVLSRSTFEGRRSGWIAAFGVATGNVAHTAAAAAGISAAIAASPWLFDTLRLAGAGYLAWLGARALLAAWRAWRSDDGDSLPILRPERWTRVYRHAVLTNLLNPKVILFYLAFVPQFVTPAAGSVAAQTLVLGLILMLMGFIYQATLGALAAGLARRVIDSRWFRVGVDGVSGLLFLAFAVRIFTTERKYA